MAAHRLRSEWYARLLVVVLVIGFTITALAVRLANRDIVVHAAMPEKGGWMPDTLTATVDKPLTLRLVSDDVMHGFAIGQSDRPAVDVLPGKPTEVTLTFDRPGTYTYYCTRWCGPNHWRMRGTITVEGENVDFTNESVPQPLYVTFGIDLDAHHEVSVDLSRQPSARRGAGLGIDFPTEMLNPDYVREHSPYEAWQSLRTSPDNNSWDDGDVWDLVSYLWRSNTTPESLKVGEQLYTQNCAACHGTDGEGDGIFAYVNEASTLSQHEPSEFGQESVTPTNFTESSHMLGAPSALLQGKIVRGGMGTGMPSWGLLFTEMQTWDLTDYLWNFVFNYKE